MSGAQLKRLEAGKIEVAGSLSFNNVADLLSHSAVFFKKSESLVFDLGNVENADSSGLALLVEWVKMAKQSGQSLSFQRIPKQMLDIARLSDLDELLPLVE